MTTVQSHSSELVPQAPPGGAAPAPARGGSGITGVAANSARGMGTTLRDALAGRWFAVITTGLITASVAAWAGWAAGTPIYMSEGLIRIAYQVPAVFRGQDQDAIPVEIYEALLQSQQAMISSRPLLEAALHEPEWASTGRGASRLAVDQFANEMKVEHKTGTDYLRVSFTDRDPAAAGAAVRSVVAAFSQAYRTQEEASQQQRLHALQQRQQELSSRLDGVRKQADAIAGGAGLEDLDRLHDAAVREVARLEAASADIRLAVIARGKSAATTDPQQIAMSDPVMRGYLADRDRLRDEITQARLSGYGENHPGIMRLQLALDLASQRVVDYVKQYRGVPAQPTNTNPPANGPLDNRGGGTQAAIPTASQSVEALNAQAATLTSLYDAAKNEMVALGTKRSRVHALLGAAADIEKDLGDVTRRIDEARLDGAAGGRLSIVSNGSTPTKPYRDRRMPAAAVGAFAGGCIPVGLVVLFELAGSKYRRVHQAQTDWRDHARLLGVLPALPEIPAHAQALDAAHSVHQIRVALQVGLPAGRGCGSTLLVSSATPGEGKTSMVASLGLAFALSGSRTLVIDCDIASRRMTRGFGMGQAPGVFEALTTGELEQYVRTTEHGGLCILPAGRSDPSGANAISPSAIRRLLAEAARNFDVVLVDAGPILGSVEASAAASCVDAVVLMVARDQQRSLVEKSVQILHSLQARLAGMVFNRAESGDFYRSSYGPSSYGSMPYRSPTPDGASTGSRAGGRRSGPLVLHGQRGHRLGPLFRSVALSIPGVDGNGSPEE
ncbi:MAG TPA: cellulose synthase operon protein YhjQ/BcsQ [Tepidisphaeraceae bacterium]|nr:cellulose synthase operon protein YhjQ/BcsQ [Tepidisphaeraceae bacterium]